MVYYASVRVKFTFHYIIQFCLLYMGLKKKKITRIFVKMLIIIIIINNIDTNLFLLFFIIHEYLFIFIFRK